MRPKIIIFQYLEVGIKRANLVYQFIKNCKTDFVSALLLLNVHTKSLQLYSISNNFSDTI